MSSSHGNSIAEIERGGTTYKIPSALAAIGVKTWALSATVSNPSSLTPQEFDNYIVPPGAINAWVGKDNQRAEWLLDGTGHGAWYFQPPGGIVAVQDTGTILQWSGTGWVSLIPSVAPRIRTITAAGPQGLTSNDDIVYVDQSVAAPITLHLPPNPTVNCRITVKDKKGDAGINNITVDTTDSKTVEGDSSAVLDTNRKGMIFLFNVGDTDWSTLNA